MIKEKLMKKVFPIFTVIVLLIVVGVVVAQSGLPGSGWKSGQTIQNVGSADAQIVLTAYDMTGNPFTCGTKSAIPGASANFLTDVDCQVNAGFLGSAVVSADQPIAAVVNVNNKGTGLASGQYQGTDGADVATTISFPLAKNDHNGRTTTFYVQNASNSTNNIDATFSINGVNYTKSYTGVPANAMVIVSPTDTTPTMPSGPGNFGSLTVVGTQPLAGSSLEHQTSAPVGENLQASKAFIGTDGATKVFCPLYRNSHTSKNQITGAQVQNVSAGPVDINFTFNVVGGGSYGPYTETNVAPGESANFYAPTLGGGAIPTGTYGSAVIESTGSVVAVVNDKGTSDGNERVTTYACFGTGGTLVNVPQAKEHFGGNTTGIQVQNVGNADTYVTLEYKDTFSTKSLTIKTKNMVAPGESVNVVNLYLLPSAVWDVTSGVPADMVNTLNGVVVTGTSDLAVIANESSNGDLATASNQDTKNFEGFSSN
jgi:hypothetical protein